jgi:actin related protein 2/3 complex subunit 2
MAPPDRREAVDVRAADFDQVMYYVSVTPEDRDTMRVSLWCRCFDEIKAAVGEGYFNELYPGMVTSPAQGYSITVAVDLNSVPSDDAGKDALAKKLAAMKRDVVGAPLWICFKSLLDGGRVPKPFYAVNYRSTECMYVIPSSDLVVVVFALDFENHIEQAIAKVFLQEIEITRRQSKDLAISPSVAYTQEPPHELKMLKGVDLKTTGNFVGYVSLAVSKRNVEAGKLEKAVGLVESYRSYLVYHIKGTKSQMHSRIRTRSSTWLQVLNRAMPEKMNVEKKTITGRTFKRN